MQQRAFVVVLAAAALALAACGSSGSKSASSSGASSSSSSATASTSESGGGGSGGGGGWPGANGCTKPSAADVGSAFGTPITSSTPAADNGCLWSAATPATGVQVSYHTPDQDPMTPVRLNLLRSTGNPTPISIPGSTEAFVRHVPVPNHDNAVAYVVYPEGVVQVAFDGPAGTLVPSNLVATVKVIVGA